MDLRYFLQGIRKIITNQAEYWEILQHDKASYSLIRNSMLLPFALLVALFGFTGSIIFTDTHLYPVYSVLYSIQCFLEITISVYIASILVVIISGPIGASVSFEKAFILIVLSLVPFFLCQIISKLFESFQFVNIMAMYGLNIFWNGSEKLVHPDERKKIYLLIAAFVAVISIYFISDLLLGLVVERIYFGYFA
jgi:hypothetical protein